MRSRVVNRIVGAGTLLVALLGIRAAWAALDGNASWGAVPYEGLLEQNGALVNGPRDLCFRLFASPAAATPLWTQQFSSVPVASGRFAVRLGSATPFNNGVESATNLYLQVAVGDAGAGGSCDASGVGNHTPLDGMQQLGAAAFAVSAKQGVPNQDFLVTGRLGVGNPAPTATLDVVGNAAVSSHAAVGGDLDVVGGVRAGSSTMVTTCGAGPAAGEGKQRYNYASHVMEYCDGTAWTPLATGIQGARAWVRFRGTTPPVIQSAYNVSGVTRNNAGDYTIRFVNNLTDTNYAVAGAVLLQLGVRNVGDTVQGYSFNTDSVSVQTGIYASGAALRDEALVSVVVFGN